MSTLIVQICEIESVERHPGADMLDVYAVKGWRIIANRKEDGAGGFVPRYAPGDRVVYCPPDSVIPNALAERLGIAKYLSPVKGPTGEVVGGRVRAIRLRGAPSYGCMFEAPEGLAPGTDVQERFGIAKWEPPVECGDGDAERAHPAFHAYTEIENIGNFPGVFAEGEEVVFTEKIHGTNCRLGKIGIDAEDGARSFVFAAGSHRVRRKEIDGGGRRSAYWEPLTTGMRALLDRLCDDRNHVVVFGEIHGAGVQDMHYGLTAGRGFRAFDVAVNGAYLDHDEKARLFAEHGVEMVPILYRGPFSREAVDRHTSGDTTLCDPSKAGRFKGREGIVIAPTKERTAVFASREGVESIGRAILKSISVDYLARKSGTDGR